MFKLLVLPNSGHTPLLEEFEMVRTRLLQFVHANKDGV